MRPRELPPLLRSAGEAAPRAGRDVGGLSAQRERAARALEETRAAMQSGDIERVAGETLKAIEASLVGVPEAGAENTITARVVAAGDRETKTPPVPLSGIGMRLKVNDRVVGETTTNVVGLAALEIDRRGEVAYELEALTPDCQVLSCQKGVWKPDDAPPAHLFEVPRSDALKPHLERARPFEDATRKARDRAALARDVAVKALQAQEKRLVEYIAELDAAPDRTRERPGDEPPTPDTTQPQPRQPRRR